MPEQLKIGIEDKSFVKVSRLGRVEKQIILDCSSVLY